ncbi:MAG: hypothetical protein GEV07_08090 [Streptosporangiales bacterium]|nr:hypothetical protein [Streptosporangiales bacterium]
MNATSSPTATVSPPPVPTGWKGYLKGVGPGLVVAMSWLGTGDLIDSSVAGGNYGYALMWAMTLACITKYFYASGLAKYQLVQQVRGHHAARRVPQAVALVPLLLGIGALITGFVLQTYIARGIGTALFHLSGGLGGDRWGVAIWTTVGILLTIGLALSKSRQYRILEYVARATVVVLILTFVTTAAVNRPDASELGAGLLFSLPEDRGVFSSLLVAVALVAAIGSSIGTLLYSEFVRDKGWVGPQYLKLQRFDLAVGLGATVLINLAIWTVAAETLQGTGRTIENEQHLSDMMATAVGSIGPTLLWISFFFITFSSFPAYGRGYATLFLSGIHSSFESRGQRYGSPENDPLYKWIQFGLLYSVPVVFGLPMFSNLVALTVAGNSVAGLLAPFVIIGILVLTSRKSMMQDGYANRPWEIAVLAAVGLFAVWASWGVVKGLLSMLPG